MKVGNEQGKRELVQGTIVKRGRVLKKGKKKKSKEKRKEKDGIFNANTRKRRLYLSNEYHHKAQGPAFWIVSNTRTLQITSTNRPAAG